MGRSFQGVVDLRLSAPRGAARRLRYLSQGNEARLQIDGAYGQSGFDAVIWGEKIAVLDHERRTYRTHELDTLRTAGEDGEVRIEPTGERRLLSGVPCERHEIDDGPVHISACVTALAGTFAPDKLEAISDVNVPAWVEELLRRQLFPLQASATGAGGRPLYSLELVRYAAGPIDEAMVAVPSNYREVTGSAAPGASRPAADSEGAP